MHISYRFRLYPTPAQNEQMLYTLQACRNLYNHFVFESRLAFKEGDDKLQFDEMQRIVPHLVDPQKIYSKVAQPVIHQFYRNLVAVSTLKKRGKRMGKIRFKSSGQFKSFTYNQSGFKLIDDSLLKLSKIGKIKIDVHRKVNGIIKEIHIKRETSDKWFAIIVCESAVATSCFLKREKAVGIDVGIKSFAYDSDGHIAEHPSFFRKSEKKLAKAQRILSRRTKGSTNREKQRVKVARIHEKIANQRNVFLHRLSRYYADNYDTIFVEDLSIDNMMRNRHLSKSISDSSWFTFFKMLEYKAERAGILFRKVEAAGTSQRCSRCGNIVKKTLAIRMHCCPSCGLQVDRDYNASLVIKQSGLDSLPLEWREVTPVEIGPLPVIKSGRQAWSMKQEAARIV